MEHRISPREVKVGMFVRGFGGSWFEHPFWWARFVVKPRHLDRLREADVPYLVIDDERGVGPTSQSADSGKPPLPETEVRPRDSRRKAWNSSSGKKQSSHSSIATGNAAQTDRKARVRELVSRSLAVVRDTFAAIRLGRPIEMESIHDVVEDIVATASQSPRTLLEAIGLKQKDEYTYLHSVAVCTLMTNVARQLGRSEKEVFDYGLAGLLHDVGKVRVDESILNKPGRLSQDEFGKVRGHPEHGYDILCATPDVPPIALDVCRHHHERPDGKGYPFGLQGEALTEAARLGAICDVYDALTSDRAYKSAWTPADAIAAMWSWEGQFDRELLFAFMQSIGIFPKGMVVELQKGRLAIILAPKSGSVRSRALVFFSTDEQRALVAQEVEITGPRNKNGVVGLADLAPWGLTEEACSEEHVRSDAWQQFAAGTIDSQLAVNGS